MTISDKTIFWAVMTKVFGYPTIGTMAGFGMYSHYRLFGWNIHVSILLALWVTSMVVTLLLIQERREGDE